MSSQTETIRNDAVTSFLFAQPAPCEDSLSCFVRDNPGNVSFQMKNMFHLKRKTWRCLMWCFASYQDSST